MTGTTLLSPIQYSLRLAVGLLTAGTLMATVLEPASAQIGAPRPLEELQTKDSADFLNGRGNGQSSTMMNIIQNAIIGSPRSMDEYTAEQRDNLDAATEQFRKQQAERLRNSQPVQPAPATSQPSLTTPSN
ncbi:hypothetical protein [Leptodesmis sichuanensis]|uniref:hypothetical protein n=1 Tax=Leptodesmis sichuanensis TaxID=2906798 RepID=UPI001F1E1DE2|nr:hypothetical protein [Leptodesmis sichuanensis]UIE39026.1 hypothetical protein KIK02_05360 [Leptodesmis sichuanensis A121]